VLILNDNVVDNVGNVPAGENPRRAEDTSAVGTWIGVILGLLVVVGLLILGIYFYRKQRAIAAKPPAPYSSSGNGNENTSLEQIGHAFATSFRAGSNRSDYMTAGVYGAPALNNGNGHHEPANNAPRPQPPPLPPTGPRLGGIGQRPPPPIQMYSMEDESTRGPIYDTINDDRSSGGSGYSSGGNGPVPVAPPQPPSTFGKPSNFGGHEYDVPEGSDGGRRGQPASRSASSVGAVTINGIAV